MKLITTIIIFLNSASLFAQTDIDSLFSGFVGDTYKTLKVDTSGTYYTPANDSTKIWFWPKKESNFKMFDLNYNLLLEGFIGYKTCSQLVSKAGKWISYYPNGSKKTEGYYKSGNQRVGLWRHFYSNGQLEKTYTLANFGIDSIGIITCMAGSYEEYFENGQIKVSGLYEIDYVSDSVDVYPEYDSLGNQIFIHKIWAKVPKSIPAGPWSYYKKNGDLLKREYH